MISCRTWRTLRRGCRGIDAILVGHAHVEIPERRVVNANEVEEDVRIARLRAREHREVVAYVNQVIGSSVVGMSTAEGTFKDVPMVDLVNHVRAGTVRGVGTVGPAEFAAVGWRLVREGVPVF
ncbi:PE-PGRS family protein [Streptomyces sp. SPB074]|nr:PE-PGRS family protein [Streptomyces sp. SPB074]